ncbi:hypothetical protein [Pseudooctadecabacter sp.]|uniref:hypothetical protein n=1 Tax=Pseudooctadecabacter sp. TaxID=1966338 RepID=UPI0035C805B2
MVLTIHHRLGHARRRTTKAAFNLPDDVAPVVFIRSVLIFTLLVEAVGAAVLFVIFTQAGVADLLWPAIFHAISAFCTAGFNNTHPIGSMAPAILMVFFFLMIIGASPAGTGGGLKTTSLAALIGLVRSTLKGRDQIRFFKRRVPLDK